MSQDEMVSLWGYGKETVNDYLPSIIVRSLLFDVFKNLSVISYPIRLTDVLRCPYLLQGN